MKRHHRLPQNLHVLPKGARTVRLCGSSTGGYIRAADERSLKKFLERGAGLCPECAKRLGLNQSAAKGV